VAIVSAGYGLINESREIAPYDVTFQQQPKPWIRKRGATLGVPPAIRALITKYGIVFVLLGDDYLLSTNPPLPVEPNQKFIYFGSPKHRWVPNRDVTIAPSAQQQATQFHDGVMTLKGRMFYLLAVTLCHQPSAWEQVLADKTSATVLALIEAGQRDACDVATT
jgi:hypothetical protein